MKDENISQAPQEEIIDELTQEQKAKKKKEERNRAFRLKMQQEKEKKEQMKRRIKMEIFIGLLLISLVWGYKSGLLSNDSFLLSVQKGSVGRVHLMLLFKQASKNEIDRALLETPYNNDIKMTKLLIKYGADVNYNDSDTLSTPLTRAALYNSWEIAKLLLDKGADPNIAPRDLDDSRPIAVALNKGNMEVTKLLLERETDINYVDRSGYTLFNYSINAENFNEEISQLLISKGAIPNLGNSTWGINNNSDGNASKKIEFLQENKVDINAQNDRGLTLIHEAVFFDNLDMVKLYVEKGANLESKDQWGQTVLMSAVSSTNMEIIEYLVEHGANVNAEIGNGLSILDHAIGIGNKEVIKYLQSKGAKNSKFTEGMLNQ